MPKIHIFKSSPCQEDGQRCKNNLKPNYLKVMSFMTLLVITSQKILIQFHSFDLIPILDLQISSFKWCLIEQKINVCRYAEARSPVSVLLFF